MTTLEYRAGLRIDVDTLRGTREGVPNVLELLDRYSIKATFFFSVGPDNMGRHLWRLLRPVFFIKMLRSKAVKLYGWDILLRGTLWPGTDIGDTCEEVFRDTAAAGHEIGLHAWDHYFWQRKIQSMNSVRLRSELLRGKETLEAITSQPVCCSAAPGWCCTDRVLLEKESLGFKYNSDCRGHSIFFPEIKGVKLTQPQVPATLPTYDELIGINGITDKNYNNHLLTHFKPDKLNVLTIHAETEGLSCLTLFEDFLLKANRQGINFVPLNELLIEKKCKESSRIVQKMVPGREGFIAQQDIHR